MSTQRLDIQGLRALAVMLVVVFHLAPGPLPGGYIGVDVFFVISGFLISGHLARQLERDGRVALGTFWARRARRLLPASLLVLAVSAVAVLLFLTPDVLVTNFTDIAFAAVYVLNWELAANSVDYLAAANAPSVAQHFWSLSVEEQFYIVWPLLLWVAVLAVRTRPHLRRRALVVAVVVLFAASLAWSVVETARSQPSAYFITTTRVWEFAAGALVAFVPVRRMPTALRAVVGWASLAMVVACGFLFTAETAFPGWIAVLPVAATALLLLTGDHAPRGSAAWVLSWRPFTHVGDISYSLYLWHWPIIVVFTALRGRAPGWAWALALFAATVVLAEFTKRFVEDPIRRGPGPLRRTGVTFAATGAAMACVVALSIVPIVVSTSQTAARQAALQAEVGDDEGCFGARAVINGCGDPYAVTDTVDPAATAADNYNMAGIQGTSACSRPSVVNRLVMDCTLSRHDAPEHTLMVLGDSHASHLAMALVGAGEAAGWDISMRTRSQCIGSEDPTTAADSPEAAECVRWADEVYGQAAGEPQIDTVLIAGRAQLYGGGSPDGLRARIDQLEAAGKQVLVMHDVPGTPNDWPITHDGPSGPSCASDPQVRTDPCAWTPPQRDDWMTRTAAAAGVPVVDTWELLCADGTCHTVIGGTIVYADDSHLATTFAETMGPWLGHALVRARAAG